MPTRVSLTASCSAIPIVAGVLVLVGWALDIEALKRVFPHLVAMNPATALLFVCAGVSLWLQRPRGEGASTGRPAAHRVAVALAMLVVATAALKLGDALLDLGVGVDQWLFSGRLDGAEGPLHNRMAPNTALNFLLLGMALLLLDVTTARGRRPSELLAIMVALGALLALLGYAYHIGSMYRMFRQIPMALHTAALFLLLTFGVLGARAHLGLMAVFTGPSLGGTMARRLLPALILAVVAVGWLRLEGERRGLYGPELGVTLYTLAFIALVIALVAWSAVSLHRTEMARRLVEEERERFFALTPDMLAILGFDGRFRSLNPAWERLLGYTRAELMARPMSELVHPDDRAATIAQMRDLIAGVPVLAFENRYCRKDGDYRWFSWNAIPLVAEGQVYATARDITEQKQAQEQLRVSEERIRSIIDTASEAFIAIDAAGMVIGWNRQAEATFGWSREQAMGVRLSDMIIPHALRARHEQGLQRFASTGAGTVLNRRIEISALRRNGEQFPVELAIWPVHAGDSHTFNAFITDISERKAAEQAIHALNAELSANATQLEQINRELESFSYTISHDLRAPLRHIDGYARMLHEDAAGQLDADMQRYLDAISEAARQMGALIDDLLAFSRLGRKPVERIAVDMQHLVERVAAEVGAADDGRVSIGPLPVAHADPALLKQVWLNLLSNALKYSAPRGTAARVSISGERDGGIVRYRIRDNGVGFDMRYADKLFGVFQRLHSQDEFEGTGVGLAIVQRIVARHGGSIEAQAELGSGASFTFELPAGAGEIMEASNTESTA